MLRTLDSDTSSQANHGLTKKSKATLALHIKECMFLARYEANDESRSVSCAAILHPISWPTRPQGAG